MINRCVRTSPNFTRDVKGDSMSAMSDLDLMIREGERTAEDFIKRGVDARTARAMEEVVKASNVGLVEDSLVEDSAFGHGPGCYGECDGLYDCSK
jgi:hypothetical protein